MSHKLATWLLVGAVALVSVGCQPKVEERFKMPEIPEGFESKLGYGAMGEKAPAFNGTDPPSPDTDAPAVDGPASDPPADSGTDDSVQ